jgi:transcriptional regulator with XRE-family HTH domain
MTGAELRTFRKAARLTQKALAQRAVISCRAVKYWERKARIDPSSWAVKRMAKALGIGRLSILSDKYARTGG